MTSDRRQFIRACAGIGAGLAPIAAGAIATSFARPSGVAHAAAWRDAFPALRPGFDSIYLDNAATTHRPQAVIDAIARFYTDDNANPARVHARARRAAERLADARQTVATFVNAADPLEIVFTRGTTEAVNLIAATWGAANLRAGDEVLLTVSEHNSNLLPWVTAARKAHATVRVIDVDEEGNIRIDELKRLLSRRTKVFGFSHVSNVLGIVNPARELCALARDAGARVFVDGAQGAPHVRIDVRDMQCDFYAFSGHKMAGPMAAGVLWARRELLDAMPPYHVGSNMAHDVTFDRATFEHGALKFQAGTPDVAQPVGLAEAMRYLLTIGHDALAAHDEALVRRAFRRLREIKGLRLIGAGAPERRVPVFTFTLEGWAAGEVAAALDRRGIAVRAGDMAALPLLQRFGAKEAVRASAYLYNTVEEIDVLAEALHDLAQTPPSG